MVWRLFWNKLVGRNCVISLLNLICSPWRRPNLDETSRRHIELRLVLRDVLWTDVGLHCGMALNLGSLNHRLLLDHLSGNSSVQLGGGGSQFHLLIHNVPTILLFSVGCVTEVHSACGTGVPNDNNCLPHFSAFPFSRVSWLNSRYVICCSVDVGSVQCAWAVLNLLTPNVNYSGRTAPLNSKVAFYIFIQQI